MESHLVLNPEHNKPYAIVYVEDETYKVVHNTRWDKNRCSYIKDGRIITLQYTVGVFNQETADDLLTVRASNGIPKLKINDFKFEDKVFTIVVLESGGIWVSDNEGNLYCSEQVIKRILNAALNSFIK